MHQVEIVVEELKIETMREFERIKGEASVAANTVKTDSKNQVDAVVDILKHDINELLEEKLDKHFISQVESLYKGGIKSIHSTQEAAWMLLSDKTEELKRQLKKCYEYACEIVEIKDKTLEKVYKASKDFLKSTLKETSKDVKKIGAIAQEQIMIMCKNAKRRGKVDL